MQRTCDNAFENPYFSRVSTIEALISITKEIIGALDAQSAGNAGTTHIRVDIPRIPTLGIGGYFYVWIQGNLWVTYSCHQNFASFLPMLLHTKRNMEITIDTKVIASLAAPPQERINIS